MHANQNVRSKPLGFSMIELLTVLVVIGIGSSMAAPALTQYVHESRTQGALDKLVADVSYARLLAIRQGKPSAVRLSSDGSYRIETRSTAGVWTPVQTVRLRDNYRGVSISGSTMSLEFSSRGLVTNLGSDVSLKLSTPHAADSVYVSPAGRVYRNF